MGRKKDQIMEDFINRTKKDGGVAAAIDIKDWPCNCTGCRMGGNVICKSMSDNFIPTVKKGA